MHAFLEKFLDILFPPSEDLVRVRKLLSVAHLYAPHKAHEVTALMHFTNPNVRALIHEAKFHANTRAQRLLGNILRTYLQKHTGDNVIVIPIPLSSARLRERGHNQVHEVLRFALEGLTLPIETSVLVRPKHTTPQTELTHTERRKNLVGAFAIRHPERIAGKHILLIDDVTTTGTTLHEAKTTLLPHAPASITCVALAH